MADRSPDKEAIVHWSAEKEPVRWAYGNLFSSAEAHAAALADAGIRRGDVCALIFRHHPDFYPLYIAVTVLGAVPSILAYPNARLHEDKFRQGIQGMAQNSGLDWILTERELGPALEPLFEIQGSTIQGIHFPLDWKAQAGGRKGRRPRFKTRTGPRPGDPFLLQHSSGTTGLQKPVLLSHRAVWTHLKNYSKAIRLAKTDKVVSWLPLYHDMGLVAAFHLPLAFGIPSVQIDPFEWVQAPALLFQAVSREKGTLSWMPNFAFNLMADRIHDEEMEGLSLESWRMVINCSEPIREESRQKFVRRFCRYGLRKQAVSSCYAMAESTFAVTQTPPGREPATKIVDRRELAKGKAHGTGDASQGRVCVSSGTPIPGCRVRIVGNSGERLSEGRIGEVAIRSNSLFDGYRNYPRKTAEVLREGWYYSGDIGFFLSNEYFIIGRKKDVIIVGGQNLYPEDIENAVNEVPGVIPGRAVAFGKDDPDLGTEQVYVVAETRLEDKIKREELRAEIRQAVSGIDVTLRKIYLVPPRWLIKSSAGKPGRKANKERIRDDF